MENFSLHLPTKLIFGKNSIDQLPEVVAGYGRKVLLTYGGGSIKRSGLYARVRELLSDYTIFELSGIEPNPKIDTVRNGVDICKRECIDFILAVGGGSVIDASKNIASGALYDGDPWDQVVDARKIGPSIPLFTVLTLSATGSEYDANAVISNPQTNEKMCLFGADHMFPVASICDPTYTQTVPSHQTAAGAADIMSHTFEQYLVKEGNIITDSLCEGMLRTVITMTPVAISNPNDYEARAQLMLTSSFGCCGLLALGRTASPWPCHAIEHEISAFYDITHGYGLAIITPHWMRYSLTKETAPRFAQYGNNVWGLPTNDDPMVTANLAIDKTSEFFSSIGIPSRLSDLGIDDSHFEEMAEHIGKCWWPLTGAFRPITKEGIVEILRNSL